MKLSDWRTVYLANRPELAEGSRTLHDQTLARLCKFLGSIEVDHVTPIMASKWRASLVREKLSPLTISRHVVRARTIWKAAVSARLATENVFSGISAAAPVVNRMGSVSREEMERVLGVLPSDDWRRLVALCRLAGLRLGEALRLDWADVDLAKGELRVRADVETTKRKERTVPIQPRLAEILKGGQTAGVVVNLGHYGLYRTLQGALFLAGVERYPKPFHSLRASLECDWIAEGRPTLFVCQWLGHTPETAMKHYAKPTKEACASVAMGTV